MFPRCTGIFQKQDTLTFRQNVSHCSDRTHRARSDGSKRPRREAHTIVPLGTSSGFAVNSEFRVVPGERDANKDRPRDRISLPVALSSRNRRFVNVSALPAVSGRGGDRSERVRRADSVVRRATRPANELNICPALIATVDADTSVN